MGHVILISYVTRTHYSCLYESEQLVSSDDTKCDSYMYWTPLQRTCMFTHIYTRAILHRMLLFYTMDQPRRNQLSCRCPPSGPFPRLSPAHAEQNFISQCFKKVLFPTPPRAPHPPPPQICALFLQKPVPLSNLRAPLADLLSHRTGERTRS